MSQGRHIEAVRAEVLAGVITRHETSADGYRDLASQTSKTKGLTPPPDRQHWRDMLVELNDALPTASGINLRTVVQPAHSGNPGYRVGEAFAQGVPVARIARRLSDRLRIPNETPWPVDWIVNAKTLEAPTFDLEPPTAERMPEFVDRLAERSQAEQKLLAPAQALTRQAREYLDSDGRTFRRLLADMARSYGVTVPGETMQTFARALVTPNWELATSVAADAIVAATDSGAMFYADGEAAGVVLDGSGRDDQEIAGPTPAGVVVIRPFEDSMRVLAWRDTGTRLDVAMHKSICKRMRKPKLNSQPWSITSLDRQTGVVDSYGPEQSGLSVLAQLARMVAVPPRAPGAERAAADGSRGDRKPVVVRYTARPVESEQSDRPVARDLEPLKWRVRGHYRRQWYPSLGEHRVIWIEDHFAERGEDGELLDRPVVTKISQPR